MTLQRPRPDLVLRCPRSRRSFSRGTRVSSPDSGGRHVESRIGLSGVRDAVADALHDISSLFVGELGVNRQRERLFGGSLALRKRAGFMSEIRKALLQGHP